MIISHKYKYLFVELPHTGSTAIASELCTYYDGMPILHKHATYDEFLRIATPEQKKYFVFSAIRNPLDDLVSYYFKSKAKWFSFLNERYRFRRYIYWQQYQKSKAVLDQDTDFATFFLKFYRMPYDNWSALSHDKFNIVLRFESLSDDFSKALQLMQIEEKRRLPVSHKTPGRERDFWSYYTPETWEHAKKVFGPFMEKWGYTFPAEWGPWHVSTSQRLYFEALRVIRKFNWRYTRPLVHKLVLLERPREVSEPGAK